jgi:trehalose-6-phosphate synthase
LIRGGLKKLMTDKEIEEVCVDIACRYDLEFNEYQEILKDSLEEAERINSYYGIV